MTNEREDRLRRKFQRIIDKKLKSLREEVERAENLINDGDIATEVFIKIVESNPKVKIFNSIESIIKELKNGSLNLYFEIENILSPEMQKKMVKMESELSLDYKKKSKHLEELEETLEDLIDDTIDDNIGDFDGDFELSEIIKKFNLALDKIKI